MNWHDFELAFLIDQGVNIVRKSLEESVEWALDLFLDDMSLLVHPERNKLSREEWRVRGLREFNSWKQQV